MGRIRYYMLTTEKEVENGDAVASTTPETVTAEYVDAEVFLSAMLRGASPVRLAEVAPRGAVEESEENGASFGECSDGWTITNILPAARIVGPEAERLMAGVERAHPLLNGDPESSDTAAAYYGAWERNTEPGDDVEGEAAVAALTSAGACNVLWSTAFSCTYGPELKALAARHLVGKVDGWTVEEYLRLTGPWLAAFGEPIHPDDGQWIAAAEGAPIHA